eukprot:6478925-Amphidinium_carterae.2
MKITISCHMQCSASAGVHQVLSWLYKNGILNTLELIDSVLRGEEQSQLYAECCRKETPKWCISPCPRVNRVVHVHRFQPLRASKGWPVVTLFGKLERLSIDYFAVFAASVLEREEWQAWADERKRSLAIYINPAACR